MTRVLALADQSKIGCITQRRFAKVGTKTHPQRGADLDRNGLSGSTETACRFEPKSPVGNSEIFIRSLRPAPAPTCTALSKRPHGRTLPAKSRDPFIRLLSARRVGPGFSAGKVLWWRFDAARPVANSQRPRTIW